MGEEYKQFLTDLWGGMDDGQILIWGYDGAQRKQSYWCASPAEAMRQAELGIAANMNVFMGAGLAQRAMGADKRVLKSEVYCIAALWLDLDIADPVHGKTNLPTTTDEALSLLRELPFDPSYIVHSGHGLQAWWCFKEPWYFRSPYERADAANLEKRLIYWYKDKARAHGWDVDSVFNLDRIMRLPGSVNYKSVPVQTTILSRGAVDDADDSDVFRYNPSDFDTFLPAVQRDSLSSIAVNHDSLELVIDPDADVPSAKLDLLREIDAKFSDSWDKKRKDFASGDYSMSTYDFSLARIACGAGWTDQEVCNLLIAFRRKHGADLKMQNKQYYQRTIARARVEASKTDAMHEITTFAQSQGSDAPSVLDPNQKDILLQSLSSMFGVQLIQIKRYVADPPQYQLVTARGSITLGDVDSLIVQRAMRSKLAAATGVYMRKFKDDQWDDVAQTLLNCCMDIPLDDAASEEGEVREWVDTYLNNKPPLAEDALEEAINQSAPIRVDGGTAIFGMDFRKWLRITQQEKLTGKKMGILLRGIGARSGVLPYTKNNAPSSRSVWIIPDNA